MSTPKKTRPTDEVVDLAEAVVLVTDRTPLPGFLRALVPANIRYHGFYSCTYGGARVLFVGGGK